MADPLTLAIGAGGALLGTLFGGGASTPAATPAAPAAPPPAAAPIQSPSGNPSTNKPAGGSGGTPSFLAGAAAPQQQNTARATLLGQ